MITSLIEKLELPNFGQLTTIDVIGRHYDVINSISNHENWNHAD